MKENAESMPSKKIVAARIKVQRLAAGRVAIAVGSATNARPIEEFSEATGDCDPSR